MRVLFVAPYVPSSIRVRPYQFVRELGRRHDVTVLALGDERDARDAERLRTFCERVEVVPFGRRQAVASLGRGIVSGVPLQAAVCATDGLARRLASLLEEVGPDVVHVEHLRAAHVVDLLPASMPKLYDSVDCISLLHARTLKGSHSLRQKLLALVELRRTRRYEARLLGRFEQVVVTSPVDARALRDLSPAARVTVVPNGVDLERFAPIEGPRDPATLVFSGKMSYHANVTAVLHFAERILPLIRRRRPDVRLRIVGSSPPPAVGRLGRNPGVEVTGRVEDMRDAIGSATVAVCPVTVKVGVQNKILEAMALGLPVVSSREGAEGLGALAGRDFLVADDAVQFAEHVCRLLDDRELQETVGQAGRRYVETSHRWDAAAGALESLYQQAIKTQSGIWRDRYEETARC